MALVAGAILVGSVVVGSYALPCAYSTYAATDMGLERRGPLGGYQRIAWNDVDRLWTPRILHGLTCLHTRQGETIVVPKGLPGYQQLLPLMASKMPRLTTEIAHQGEWSSSLSWFRFIRIIVVTLLGFYILRLIYRGFGWK
jgi:hypothetical protein